MKINKYNKPKDGSNTGRITSISGGSISGRTDYADEAGLLAETHLIYGLPFNGTLDVDGDLSTSGNITAEGDITGSNVNAGTVNTDLINAENGNINHLSGSTIGYDEAAFKQAVIDALSSTNITTDYLTVTKLAHFFELIIDKIKAAGGAVLLTPADGFKVDRVKIANGNPRYYKLYWKADNGEKGRANMWQVGDLAICLTFNATEGVSTNVSNKYYWSVVSSVGTDIIEGENYHYILIAGNDTLNNKADYDGIVNPEVGDEIAMLGYRGEDVNRLSAIYMAAYNSIDGTLQAPLICHYKGINDFNLSNHKYTWFAANGSEIRGNVRIESGESLEDIANSSKIANIIYEYKADNLGTVPPTLGWILEIPKVEAGLYLWTKTTTYYANGSKNISYSVTRFGADGEKGNAGADGTSCNLNLLLGTKDFSGDDWVNLQYWEDTGEYYLGCKVIKRSSNQYGVYKLFNAEAGKTYTFSSYLRSDGGDARYYFTITDAKGVVTPLLKDVPESEVWSRLGVSFKCTTSGEIACRVLKAAGSGAIYVAGYKLEEGDVENNTVWIPAALEMLGADYYTLNPLIEKAWITTNGDVEVNFSYLILHCEGDKTTVIYADNKDILVRAYDDINPSKAISFTTGNTPAFIEQSYLLSQYGLQPEKDVKYFTVELVINGVVVNRRFVTVIYLAGAIFEITDTIFSRVLNTEGRMSEIEQTAESIRLQVDEIALRIDGKGITLDGDTKINGDLTMDNSDLGFILIGDSGITQIKPKSIGSYDEFSSKSSLTIVKEGSASRAVVSGAGVAIVDLEHPIGQLNKNVYILLAHLEYYSTVGIKYLPVYSASFLIYKDGELTENGVITMLNPTTNTFFTYNTPDKGYYTIKIRLVTDLSGINEGTVNSWVRYFLILPTDAISILGYDGYASNFGNNKVVYFGGEQSVLSYGDYALRFTPNGILKYVSDNLTATNLRTGIYQDSAKSLYISLWVGFNGCGIRRIVSSGDVYLNPKDDFLLIDVYTTTVDNGNINIYLSKPVENIGRKVYIKNKSSNTVNLICNPNGLVNPNNSNTIGSYNPNANSVMLLSDGNSWIIFNGN